MIEIKEVERRRRKLTEDWGPYGGLKRRKRNGEHRLNQRKRFMLHMELIVQLDHLRNEIGVEFEHAVIK